MNLALKIGGVPEHFNLPIKKAIFDGVFEAKNIHFNWLDFPKGTGAMIEALNENHINAAILLTEGAIKFLTQNPNYIFFDFIVTAPLYWGVFVSPNSSEQLTDFHKFAISRPGSGSHLMAYHFATTHNISEDLVFETVGDIESLADFVNRNPNYALLWEEFMTQKFVQAQLVKQIGVLPTPWASFCMVIRRDMAESFQDEIQLMRNLMHGIYYKFKQNATESIDYICKFYDLGWEDMKVWFDRTEWNDGYLDKNFSIAQLKICFDFLKQQGIITNQDFDNFIRDKTNLV
ncbi:MAG: hypothetical protein MUE53_07635 [Chitinophagales bacterium]|jgi:hypothetical protein|nr:hypothetical protein [Chitinophagales bacterium]